MRFHCSICSLVCSILQEKKEQDECYHCLSDFISPDKDDYIGMFAVSAGFGVDELCEKYVILLSISVLRFL